MDDARDAHEHPTTKFHFSWILILISFAVWAPSPDYQPMDILVELLAMPYQNLWDHKDTKCKTNAKLTFFLQGESLRNIVCKKYRLRPMIVAKYPFIHFHARLHNIIKQPCNHPKKKELSTLFMLRDVDIEQEIKDWPKEWFSQY